MFANNPCAHLTIIPGLFPVLVQKVSLVGKSSVQVLRQHHQEFPRNVLGYDVGETDTLRVCTSGVFFPWYTSSFDVR